MEQLISFLKKEFPKDVLDIQECVDLLNQCIGGSVESIKSSFNAAIDQREYEKLSMLQEMLVTIDKIQNKLDEYSSKLQLEDEIENKIIEGEVTDEQKLLPDYDSLRVDPNIPHTLYDDYTHKRPAGFEIFDKRYDVKDWKDILVKASEILAKRDINLFLSFLDDKSMQGKKVTYFCKNAGLIRAPRKIDGTDVYVMTNMSANQVRNVVERMLRKYNIKINDFKLYLKADYSARHV